MRVVANLGFLFQEVPLLERYKMAAEAGFKLVECPNPYTESAEALRQAANKYRLQHTLINAPPGDWDKGQRGLASLLSDEEFAPTIRKGIEYCKVLNCERLHVMAGIAQPDDIARRRYIQNIGLACELCEPHGILVFIEPICRQAIPMYFLNSIEMAEELTNKLDKVFILLDFFHLQQMRGCLTDVTNSLGDKIKYIQAAQVPHRHEPDTCGEINYEYLFQMLRNSGHKNTLIGCEYKPLSGDFSWVKKYDLSF